MNAHAKKHDPMDRKIISVSKKRQITIPLKYYRQLGLDHELECTLEDGAIVLRPLKREPSEFSTEILKDLIAQGYSGDELVRKFEEESENIKKAVDRMLEEADDIASGKKDGEKFHDLFDSEDE